MKQHVAKVAVTCYYQLRRLRQIRRRVGREVTICLVLATVMSRIDYCNSALAGLPQSTLAPLQRVDYRTPPHAWSSSWVLENMLHPAYSSALAARTLANPVQTVLPNALSLSWKLPSVLEEHGTVRQCQPTSATSTSQIDVIQLLHAATVTV